MWSGQGGQAQKEVPELGIGEESGRFAQMGGSGRRKRLPRLRFRGNGPGRCHFDGEGVEMPTGDAVGSVEELGLQESQPSRDVRRARQKDNARLGGIGQPATVGQGSGERIAQRFVEHVQGTGVVDEAGEHRGVERRLQADSSTARLDRTALHGRKPFGR